MKSAKGLIFCIIAGMIGAAVILYSLTDYCYVTKPFSVGHGEQQKFYYFNQHYTSTAGNDKSSAYILSVIKNVGANTINDPSAKDNSNETPKSWWRDFLCGIKI